MFLLKTTWNHVVGNFVMHHFMFFLVFFFVWDHFHMHVQYVHIFNIRFSASWHSLIIKRNNLSVFAHWGHRNPSHLFLKRLVRAFVLQNITNSWWIVFKYTVLFYIVRYLKIWDKELGLMFKKTKERKNVLYRLAFLTNIFW